MYPIENARSSKITFGTIVSSKLYDIKYDDNNCYLTAKHAYLVYKGDESEVIIEDKEQNKMFCVYRNTWEKAQLFFDDCL